MVPIASLAAVGQSAAARGGIPSSACNATPRGRPAVPRPCGASPSGQGLSSSTTSSFQSFVARGLPSGRIAVHLRSHWRGVTAASPVPSHGWPSPESEGLELRRSEAGTVRGISQHAGESGAAVYPDKAQMYLMRSDGISCTREVVTESKFRLAHPSTQQQLLVWKDQPKTVLLLKKLGDDLLPHLAHVAKYLALVENLNVIVEPSVRKRLIQARKDPKNYNFVQTFEDPAELTDVVDFMVCLGGDGVILHAASLFRTSAVPPVVSFHLGSLGFLTAHSFKDYKTTMRGVIHGATQLEACTFEPLHSMDFFESFDEGPRGVYVTLRMRLLCTIYRNGRPLPGGSYEVMNEVVVDRGSNPYLTKIECYEKGQLITKVQADGVLLSTPTGSTAYSVAAGGSMVHPNISAILFTPICPHSLSFRPIIMPDYAEIELRIPQDARCTAWVCFDGKARQELERGDSIFIKMSQHPVPTIGAQDATSDWFTSLERCLSWNERPEQGELPVESDLSLSKSRDEVETALDSMDMDSFIETAQSIEGVDAREA